jgi:hypothetical protein
MDEKNCDYSSWSRYNIFESFCPSLSFDDWSFLFMSYAMDMNAVTCRNS